MKIKRRSFLKTSLTLSAIVAASGVKSLANEPETSSNGVVVGKSKKKEILYKSTPNWEKFYKAAW